MSSNFLDMLVGQSFLSMRLCDRKVLNLFFMFYHKQEPTKLTVGQALSILPGVKKSQLIDSLLKLRDLKVLSTIDASTVEVVVGGKRKHSLKNLRDVTNQYVPGVVFEEDFNRFYYLNLDPSCWKYSASIPLSEYMNNFKFIRDEKEGSVDNQLTKRVIVYFCEKYVSYYKISYKVHPIDARSIREILDKFRGVGFASSEVFNFIDSVFEIKKDKAKFFRFQYIAEEVDRYISQRRKSVKSNIQTDWTGKVCVGKS